MLPHLSNGWQVDQAILAEEDRVVLIRFGHDWDPSCMRMDEVNFTSFHYLIESCGALIRSFIFVLKTYTTSFRVHNTLIVVYDDMPILLFPT